MRSSLRSTGRSLVLVALAGWALLSCASEPPDRSNPYDPGSREYAFPFAPEDVTAAAGIGQVTISWSAVPGADGYDLHWTDDSTTPSEDNGNRVANVSSPHMHTGLSNGTTYRYAVVAFNDYGRGAFSAVVSATPSLPPVPLAPGSLAALASSRVVTLEWSAVESATSYHLYWTLGASGPTKTTGTRIADVTSPYAHGGLLDGTTYRYVVTAADLYQESDESAPVEATPYYLPPAVTNLRALPGETSIALVWDPAPDAAGYIVYRTTSQTPPGPTNGTRFSIGVTNFFYQLGLSTSNTCTYAVAAAGPQGHESAPSLPSTTAPHGHMQMWVEREMDSWGLWGTMPGQFRNPTALAGDDVFLYVADEGNHRIQKFQHPNTFIAQFGQSGSGPGQLNGVTDLAVHGSYLYVLDAGNCRVQKLDTSGSFVFQFGTQGTGNGQFAPGASGIAVDPEGRIYVADTGNHRIQKFASDGTFVASVGAFGSGNGEFNRPMGLCVGAGYAGRIHVADCGNHRIVVLETNLAYQTAFGTDGNGFNLQFHSPRSVSWNSGSGDLFVVDAGNHRIVACEPNGNATLHILGLPGRGTNRLFHPAAILPRGGMAIEILDAGNTRIAVFAYLG